MKKHISNISSIGGLGVVGLTLGIITLLIWRWMPYNDGLRWYYLDTVFPTVRGLIDNTISRLPYPPIYFGIGFLVLFVVGGCWHIWRSNHNYKLLRMIWGLVGTFGVIYFLFYLLWGFNYRRQNIKSLMGITLPEIDSTYMYNKALSLVSELNALYPQINHEYYNDVVQMEVDIRESLKQKLSIYGLPVSGNPRVRIIEPKGVLLSIATTGVYIPHVGEGHVDAGLFPVQYASTMAHEMSHGFGFGDEGECNFLAIQACVSSNNPQLIYSGKILYLRYLTRELYVNHRPMYNEVFNAYGPGLKADLIAIRDSLNYYKEFFTEWRYKIYDYYLRRNGISEGHKSYSSVINMLKAMEQDAKFTTIR